MQDPLEVRIRENSLVVAQWATGGGKDNSEIFHQIQSNLGGISRAQNVASWMQTIMEDGPLSKDASRLRPTPRKLSALVGLLGRSQ